MRANPLNLRHRHATSSALTVFAISPSIWLGDSTAADAQQHYSQPHHATGHITAVTYPSLGHAIAIAYQGLGP